MKRISKCLLRALAPAAIMLALLLTGGPVVAVTITIGSASGQVGDTVALPITITGLTEDVRAYELDVSWWFQRGQCVGINTTGTLSEFWSVSQLSGSGTVTVAGASATPLAGDGVLVELLMELGPGSGTTTVTLGAALLNEGDPVPTRVNGSMTATALPTINITPDTGLMAVGDSLRFSTSGGTPPYTYTSDKPLVAAFTDDWLHALAPGFVRATAEDAGLITNTTTGLIEVRPFRLTVGAVATTSGQEVLIPVTLDDPAGYAIVACEVQLTWSSASATFTGIETAGTIAAAAGWMTPVVVPGAGEVTVTMAGTAPLSGAGVLFYLKLVPTSSVWVNVGTQVFNEVYTALTTRGLLTATPLPTIGITPQTASLRVGNQLQFNVTGSPTPPYSWSTDAPAVATINAAGLLTAWDAGAVRVTVVDDLGATAQTGVITVCPLGMPALISSIGANESVLVPVTMDRTLDDLGIYSYEIAVNYSAAHVTFVGAVVAGTVSGAWGTPTVADNGSTVSVYHAGANALTGCGPALFYLEFQGLPSLGSPYGGVSLGGALYNEGAPCLRLNTGTSCENLSSVPGAVAGLKLWPNQPNPFNPSTTIRYRLAADGIVDLAVYSARGERVRTLATGWRTAASVHTVSWDGRDDDGRMLSSGVYYTLLRSEENRALQKMVLLK